MFEGADEQYSEVPTTEKTLPMSKMLLEKYMYKKYVCQLIAHG